MLRQIFFLGTYAASMIGAFIHPIYGLMGYIYEWGHHPPLFWWGNNWPDLRWSLLISLVLLASFIIRHNSLKKLVTEKFTVIYWMVALWVIMIFVSSYGAVDYWASWDKVNLYIKMIVLYYLMVHIPRIPKHYKFVIWMFLFTCFDFGFIATMDGSNRDLRVSGPGAGDENAVSAHVLTAIPFFILYFFSGKKIEKIASVLMLPFVLNLIILGNSRGAMLAVAVMVLVGFVLSKGKVRRYYLIGIILGAALFFRLTNQQFWDRQQTISTYEEDSSSRDRIVAWNAALEMMRDYPLGMGGGGYDAMNVVYVPEFAKSNKGAGKTVHNTYLLVGTEWGIPGLIIFMGFLIHSFIIILRIKRDAKFTRDPIFYDTEGTALILAMIGILVAGIFINRPYAEVIYWLSAFGVALRNIQFNELSEMEQEELEPEDLEEIQKAAVTA